MADATAKYILQAEDRTKLALKRAKRNFQDLSRTVSKVGGVLAAFGAGITFGAVIDATIKQENALRQLEARLKSTNGVVGLSAEEIQNLAGELQNLTTFGDEAVIEMQNLLLTFTNIRGGIFEDTTKAILDMSVAMDQDLKTSALQLGKALNNPIKGLSALSRAGIQFSDAQKDAIAALVETGEVAKAQRLILQELEVQFGGAAEAAADTFGGALSQLGNAFGDLLEQKNGLNDAKGAIQDLTRLLQDPAISTAMNNLVAGAATLAGWMAKAAASFVEFGQSLGEAVAIITHGEIDAAFASEQERIERINELTRERMDLIEAQANLERKVWNGTAAIAYGGLDAVERYSESLQRRIEGLADDIERLQDVGIERASQPQAPEAADIATPDVPSDIPYSIGGAEPAKAEKQRAKQINDFQRIFQSMQRQLATLGDLTQSEKTLWEIQNGRFKDLTEAQQQALLDAASSIDQKRAAIEAEKSIAEVQEETARQQAAYNESQEDAAQRWRELLNPMEEIDQQLNELDILLAEGRISWETYGEAVFSVTDAMDSVGEKAAETGEEMSQFAIQAQRNIQSAFGDEILNLMEGNFSSVGDAFKSMLNRMVADLAASQLLDYLKGIGSGGGGGGFDWSTIVASFFHDGGIVGTGGTTGVVNPFVFAGAPSFHDGGLAGDEIPAILQRGEEVLTRNDPRHARNGGSQASVYAPITIQAADPETYALEATRIRIQQERSLNRQLNRRS